MVANPVVASSAAMRLRACPPMVVNSPAAYTRLPFTASASTFPGELLALGFQAVAVPVVASRAAMWLRN